MAKEFWGVSPNGHASHFTYSGMSSGEVTSVKAKVRMLKFLLFTPIFLVLFWVSGSLECSAGMDSLDALPPGSTVYAVQSFPIPEEGGALYFKGGEMVDLSTISTQDTYCVVQFGPSGQREIRQGSRFPITETLSASVRASSVVHLAVYARDDSFRKLSCFVPSARSVPIQTVRSATGNFFQLVTP